jgi:hypothetical protein
MVWFLSLLKLEANMWPRSITDCTSLLSQPLCHIRYVIIERKEGERRAGSDENEQLWTIKRKLLQLAFQSC